MTKISERLGPDAMTALRGRGYSDEEIDAMDAEKIFKVWAAWTFGYEGWGETILSVWRDVERAAAVCSLKSDGA